MGFLSALCIFFAFYKLSRKAKENNIDNKTNTATFNRIKKKEYKPPVITCDYCGSKVDTAIYDRCPNCGASYDLDSEWINRFDAYEEESDYNQYYNSSNTGSIYQRTFQNYGPNKVKQKKTGFLKKTFIILTSIFIAIFVLSIIVYIFDYDSSDIGTDYRGNEKVNEYSYEDYQLVDYTVEGDGQILNYYFDNDENQNITVTLKNIYQDNSSYRDGYKFEFEVVNNSDRNVKIVFSAHTFNSYSDYDGSYLYSNDNYKKHSTVTVYEELSNVAQSGIKNISFERCSILTTDSSTIYDRSDVATITTTSTIDIGYNLSRYHVIYSNDYVDIYSAYDYVTDSNTYINYDEGLKYYIVNKTEDLSFDVETDGYLGQGKSLYTYGLYNTVSIPGTTLLTSEIYSYEDYFSDVKNKELYISFDFKCKENPLESFSTGYIDLKTEYWRSEG